AELDYAGLSNEIAQTLNDVGSTQEPPRRLVIVEKARKALAEWPAHHFNYREAEVRQMVAMLDEAIASLRAATGARQFDLTLVATTEPVPFVRMLPPPTPTEA